MSELASFVQKLKGVQFIVINDCYGGFSLSDRAVGEYKTLSGITDGKFYVCNIPRDDTYLVKVVRELGMAANGSCANLKIVEVPADVDWIVQDYDGEEWIAEVHRTWS